MEESSSLNQKIKTVRTYQSDVAETIKKDGVSVSKMVLAEKKKKENLPTQQPSKKIFTFGFFKITIYILTAILVVGLGYYFYKKEVGKTQPQVTEIQIPKFIFSNYQREIFLKNSKRKTLTDAIAEEKQNVNIPLGSVIQLFFTTKDSSEISKITDVDGFKILLPTEYFFGILETKIPKQLTRALEPDFVFGFHSSLGNNPFLIFKIKSYENAFSGMLEWEKTITSDLKTIFEKKDTQEEPFKDIILSNKDIRAILNLNGRINFAYSFPDKETLIIADNETTLQEIFRRINISNLERKD